MASSSGLSGSSGGPFCFFIFLLLLVMMLPGLLVPMWINKVNGIESQVKIITTDVHQELVLRIERTARLLSPFNQSAIELATLVSTLLGQNELHFSAIETRAAPVLFEALKTIPYVSQVSFIGLNGLFFSYYTKGNQQLAALYSNTSFSPTMFPVPNYTWYTSLVDSNTGRLYGETVSTNPRKILDSNWFQKALKSINGYASIGSRWENDQDSLILSTVRVGTFGAISLGFHGESLIEFLTDASIDREGLYIGSNDGTVIARGIPNTRMIRDGDLVSFQLLDSNGEQIGFLGNLTCKPNTGKSGASLLEIRKIKYLFQCSPIEILGMQSVYVLALPSTFGGLENIHHSIKSALVILIVMATANVISIFTFIFLMVRASRREMHLCGALIKQMEATQQAERKSMNTSLAYATASHDVRASLAGIIGLIEMCRAEVRPGSDLETNLRQAEACTKDLLGILNSILDTSKIEAGQIQLQEEEFDLEELVEDTVDLYHPVGMKKGVDVVLDTCDGSLTKYSQVKGDRGRLKQILVNLLSNAVKFTSEGHVSVRIWAKKPSLENPVLASSRNSSILRFTSCLFFWNDRTYEDMENIENVRWDENRMEFIFEVDDTGKGIPKEKQKIVFENYVQVREVAAEHGGTGLGLGIVQSLVRLMGGEIAILDKEHGEKGTCFRFNTFLTVRGTEMSSHSGDGEIDSYGGYSSSTDLSHQSLGQIIRTRKPKPKGSHVIIFISSEERSKILKKFMQKLGIQVSVVKQYQHLLPTLKKIKEKLFLTHPSISPRQKGVPLSTLDGAEDLPVQQKKRIPNFVLVLIDINAGPFREVSRAVAEFRRDLSGTLSRVVWIDRPGARSMNAQQGLDSSKLPAMDIIMSKPLHGSRLYQVIGLLPEFGSIMNEREMEEGTRTPPNTRNASTESFFSIENIPKKVEEIQEINNRPLIGKKVLVAEDNPVLRKVAVAIVSKLGAETYQCQNGEEATVLVLQKLYEQREHRARFSAPFDYILMDCEMPVMNGYEATRRIREEEKHLDLHIPIIALTAHTANEVKKMTEAGMDYHLNKPLRQDQLLEAIFHIQDQ